jgi:hypothetical protein
MAASHYSQPQEVAMKRLAVLIVCLVLVLASVGSVAAQQGYTVHVPIVMRNADEYSLWRTMIATMDSNAWVYAATGYDTGGYTYAGMITSEIEHSNSLINPYGEYGNPESEYSINNSNGMYGSLDSPYSAMNPEATDPPKIVWVDWVHYGDYDLRLTTNPAFPYRIDTTYLLAELRRRATQGQ